MDTGLFAALNSERPVLIIAGFVVLFAFALVVQPVGREILRDQLRRLRGYLGRTK